MCEIKIKSKPTELTSMQLMSSHTHQIKRGWKCKSQEIDEKCAIGIKDKPDIKRTNIDNKSAGPRIDTQIGDAMDTESLK